MSPQSKYWGDVSPCPIVIDASDHTRTIRSTVNAVTCTHWSPHVQCTRCDVNECVFGIWQFVALINFNDSYIFYVWSHWRRQLWATGARASPPPLLAPNPGDATVWSVPGQYKRHSRVSQLTTHLLTYLLTCTSAFYIRLCLLWANILSEW